MLVVTDALVSERIGGVLAFGVVGEGGRVEPLEMVTVEPEVAVAVRQLLARAHEERQVRRMAGFRITGPCDGCG